MKMNQCNAPFEGYRSSGPRWDRYSGRLTLTLFPMHGDSKKLSMSYARYMMSASLKRVLDTSEEVDHIDGDRTHDILSNLQILTKSENSRKTVQDPLAIARRRKLMWFICPHCDTRFERPRSLSHLARNGQATYCNRVCGSYSKLYLNKVQVYGKVYGDFVPKNLGEPWDNWSVPIPVEVRSTGSVSRKKKITICKHCFKPFPAERGKIYCCDACARAERSQNVPPKSRMLNLVEQVKNKQTSWAAIGRDYGVSDNAARKWAKKYGLL